MRWKPDPESKMCYSCFYCKEEKDGFKEEHTCIKRRRLVRAGQDCKWYVSRAELLDRMLELKTHHNTEKQ